MTDGISEAAFHLLALSTTITFAYVGFDRISLENGQFSARLRDTRKSAEEITVQLKTDSFGNYINDLLSNHKIALSAIFYFKREALNGLANEILESLEAQSKGEFSHFSHFESAADSRIVKRIAIWGNFSILAIAIIFQFSLKYQWLNGVPLIPYIEILSILTGLLSLGALIFYTSVAHKLSLKLDANSSNSWIYRLKEMEKFIKCREDKVVSSAHIAA